MRILIYALVCFLMVCGMGCGKGQEELVSFTDQIVQLQRYNQTLVRYLHLIETRPEDLGEAHQVGSVLQEYYEAVCGIPRPGNLSLAALHRRYRRALEKAQERIRPLEDRKLLPGHPVGHCKSPVGGGEDLRDAGGAPPAGAAG